MSTKLKPIDYKDLEKILVMEGFQFDRQKGSHRCFVKNGTSTVVVPMKKDIVKGTLMGILKTAGISKNRFTSLLGK